MVSREEVRHRMQALRDEQARRKRLLALRKDSLRRAAYLRAKLVIDPHEVYALVKEFFKGFIGKSYEFTVPQLREELRHIYLSHEVRSDVQALLEVLHQLEYANIAMSREQLVAMIDLFKRVVQEAVRAQVRPKSFFVRIKEFLWHGEEDPALIIAELPVIESLDAEQIALRTLASRCYGALDRHDGKRARAAYRALLLTYQSLPAEHQKAHYHLVEQTFRDLDTRLRAK